jgi:class 3 adenylate cyclase/tetratricopeptide (TPR) repeat protein
MICANCGSDNTADATFCEQCGRMLERFCPACNASVSPGARFCKKCGGNISTIQRRLKQATTKLDQGIKIRLPAKSAPADVNDAERKTVTALFADLEGSTELIRDLDPESARAIVDPALKIMVEAVRYYDGYVVQSTGDGIFALFGAPLADENHPQRALYAALRMQELLRQHSQRLLLESKPPVKVRVGVNSGEVVMRSVETGGRAEYVPVGYVTNLAARMQTAVRAGEIAISEETRHLVEGYFELRPLGPTKVKGVAEPVNVYEVSGLGPLRTRFDVSTRRGLTPFVGREDELQQIKRTFKFARDGHGQILALVAEPGAGKTRLLHEFKRELPAACKLLQADSVAYGKGSAYQPVLELLNGYFGIDYADDKSVRRAKVETRLTTLDPALKDMFPYIFALLGIQSMSDPIAKMGPLVKRRRTLEAFKRIVLGESLKQPTVVICEDLHWIDSETQALLDLLADGIADAHVLLLVTYRPEYRHEWGNKSYYTELRLDRLSQESAEAMLGMLLGEAAELESLKRLIDERTDGNPLFIEETVQALFDEGTLVRDPYPEPFSGGDASSGSEHMSDVKVIRPLSQLRLPPTVQGILAARIDRLNAEHKELLQTLAVIGRESPVALIGGVVSRPPGELEQMLGALQAGEFIYEQLDAGGARYKFKHARTQEVAYNSLLIERRKQIHQRAAEVIESTFTSHLEDYLAELAHHYSRGDNASKAVEYLGLTVKREIAKSAYESALQQLTTARELISRVAPGIERDRIELDLLIDYGVTLLVLRGFYVPELGEIYQRAAILCKTLGENRRLLSVLFGLSTFRLCRAELKLARQHVDEMRLLPLDSENTATILTGWLTGNTQFFMGEFSEAQNQFEQAIARYDKSIHRNLWMQSGQDLCVSCLAYEAMVLLIMGFPDQGENRLAASLSLARELGHPFTLAVCLVTAANYYCIQRDFGRLPAIVAETSELVNEHGFMFYGEAIKGFEIIGLAFERKTDELRAKSRSSKRFSELRYELALTWAQSTLAEAFADLRLFEVANQLLSEAIVKMNRNDERFVESEIHRVRGLLTLKQLEGRTPSAEEMTKVQTEAEQAFRAAHAIALRQGAKLFALRAAVSMAGLLIDTQRRHEGEAMLEQCLSSFTEGFDSPDLIEARAILDRCRAVANPSHPAT